MEHKLWAGKNLKRGLFQVRHEPGEKGRFREKLFVDKDKLLIFLSPAPWRCVEATKSYSQRPTGAHVQFYTISNNHTSCVQPVRGDSAGWDIPSHPLSLLLDFTSLRMQEEQPPLLYSLPSSLSIIHPLLSAVY